MFPTKPLTLFVTSLSLVLIRNFCHVPSTFFNKKIFGAEVLLVFKFHTEQTSFRSTIFQAQGLPTTENSTIMSPYDDPINFDPYDRPKRTRAPYEGPNDFDNYDRPRPPPRTSNRYSGPNDFDNIDRPPQSSAPYSQYPPSSFTREPSPTYASRHQYRSPFPDEPYRPNYREENPFANVYNPYSTSPPNVSSFGSTEQYGSGPSYGSRGRDSDSSSSRPTPGPESRERTRSSHWWSSASGHRSSEPHSGGQSQNSDPSPPRRGGGVFDWFGTSPSPTTDGFSSKRGRTGYPGDYNR